MSDSRTTRAANLSRQITLHAQGVADAIMVRSMDDPIDVIQPEIRGRAHAVSDPTGDEIQRFAAAQLRDGTQLVRLLTGHPNLNVLGALEICERLDVPVDIDNLDGMADELHGGNPHGHSWRTELRNCANAWHVCAEAILDGWYLFHQSRWCDENGLAVLDEMVDLEATQWLQRIGKLESRLASMRRRVIRQPQRVLTPCQCDEDCGRMVDRPREGRRVAGACRTRMSRSRRNVS